MWIDTPAQLRSLASPVRQEIVDVLVSAGPASIAQLAAFLGRPADGLYFHIRSLLRSGLLVEHAPRRSGRHAAARYGVPGRPLRIRWSARHGPAIGRVMRAALRLAARDLERSLGRPFASTAGPHRTLWSGRSKGWVGPADMRRINRLVTGITAILQRGKPGDGRTLQTFTFVSAPTPPKRRATSATNKTTTKTTRSSNRRKP